MPRRQTFLCSKGKGNSRGLPSPPRRGPARGPHLQLSLGGPRTRSAAVGGGGGCRRLATCTFESKQTRSPRARPAAGHRPLSPAAWDLWEPPPPKGCRASPPPETSRARVQRPGLTHTPRAHTPTVARAGTTPPPPPRRPKKLSKLSARPNPRPQPSGRPALTFPGGFPAHAASVGCGTARPGRGAPGERASYLPGLTPA